MQQTVLCRRTVQRFSTRPESPLREQPITESGLQALLRVERPVWSHVDGRRTVRETTAAILYVTRKPETAKFEPSGERVDLSPRQRPECYIKVLLGQHYDDAVSPASREAQSGLGLEQSLYHQVSERISRQDGDPSVTSRSCWDSTTMMQSHQHHGKPKAVSVWSKGTDGRDCSIPDSIAHQPKYFIWTFLTFPRQGPVLVLKEFHYVWKTQGRIQQTIIYLFGSVQSGRYTFVWIIPYTAGKLDSRLAKRRQHAMC
ncbi:hypothetical protein RRG08_039486 [Elysia crispata]|uniref:Uncharacterized protein n=1 Tax=Elysia crispata TaxID=231223 RepID=A0AAE1CZV9_9GAST|nr:hypothetical protein RRG08_039486 [Elysia crispata]